jgi:hypothetical protein
LLREKGGSCVLFASDPVFNGRAPTTHADLPVNASEYRRSVPSLPDGQAGRARGKTVIAAALRKFLRIPISQWNFARGAVNRRFGAILGLSILFHAVLFALTAWQRQNRPRSLPPFLVSIRLIDVAESGTVAAVAPAPASLPRKALRDASGAARQVPRDADCRASQCAGQRAIVDSGDGI